ncbi:hypothetical protein CN160_35095 [Sinorhizobium meliloti]|nr:hypothetical protein CN160_35095 [Sinorhizobium meliloti]
MRDLPPDRACSCAFTCPNDRNSPNNEGNRMAALRQIAFYGKAEALGPVDKVDSQISRGVIQDCFLGGGFGTRRPFGYGMADHRGAAAHRTRQEVSARA